MLPKAGFSDYLSTMVFTYTLPNCGPDMGAVPGRYPRRPPPSLALSVPPYLFSISSFGETFSLWELPPITLPVSSLKPPEPGPPSSLPWEPVRPVYRRRGFEAPRFDFSCGRNPLPFDTISSLIRVPPCQKALRLTSQTRRAQGAASLEPLLNPSKEMSSSSTMSYVP